MKIIQLEVQNFKRLSAVNITPEGNVFVIGGQNGAGKSSVLDSIEHALTGGNSSTKRPLKEGERKGHITVNIGKFIITRRFVRREDQTISDTLEVKNADGYKVTSPQALLNSLYGEMTFDPLEFSRLKPKEQLETLKSLVKLDFTEFDQQIDTLYSERTDLNRALKEKAANLNNLKFETHVGIEEISISNLLKELSDSEEKNNDLNELRRLRQELSHDVKYIEMDIESTKQKIKELSEYISQREIEMREVSEKEKEIYEKLICVIPIDTQKIKEKIENAESTNQKIRENSQYMKLTDEINIISDESDKRSQTIKTLENRKESAMKSAKFPVSGMSFNKDGITMNGIPFEQASSAEKLRISVAMGIALNPELKLMQIKDGSLLDKDSMILIEKMATESDTLILIERVGEGQECSIIISDGYIKGDENFL